MSDVKTYHLEQVPTVVPVPDFVRAEGGLIVDTEGIEDSSAIKLAKDGTTVLLPQPTDHEGDPLNWSSTKKHLVLFTIAWGALCSDFVGACSSSTVIAQSAEWGLSLNSATQPTALAVFFLGISGLVWIPMSSYWGRAPVLFWTAVMAMLFSIGTALANDFATFFGLRVLTAIFCTAAQTVSLAFLKDIFFFHERTRKIGLWALLYICSPYIGPGLGNFVVGKTGDWKNVYWMCVGVLALQILFILSFVDETWFNRQVSVSGGNQPARAQTFAARLYRILGIWQIKNHDGYFRSFKGSYRALGLVIAQKHFALIALSYFLTFMWSIGINITTSTIFGTPVKFGGYGYNNVQIGYLYMSPIVGVLLAEIFGHFFNDFLARRYIHKHKGRFEPEVRLWSVYISAWITIPGLILVGQAVQHKLLWVAAAVGWAMVMGGIMVDSVAITAYSLDAFPSAPAEVAAWLNMARTMGGFAVGYFQEPWGAANGYDVSFGIQAVIAALAVIPVVVVHRYGHRMRVASQEKLGERGFF